MGVEDLGNLTLIRYERGCAFDRSLETVTMNPVIWPLIKGVHRRSAETSQWDALISESRSPDSERQRVEANPAGLHCAREGRYWATRYQVKDGRIFCNDLVCFFYLTDVNPGDAGLIVIPGSHKSQFKRPDELLTPNSDGIDPEPDPVFTNLTPQAGDFLFCSELLTHGVLRWKPKDYDRRFLIFRYRPQFEGKPSLPQKIIDRLVPETQELVASASYGHGKEIARRDVVTVAG